MIEKTIAADNSENWANLRLSIVVPCYNEEEVLETTLGRLQAVAENSFGSNYEVILTDDGSVDKTWEIIKSRANADSRLVGVRLSRNHGHQLALVAGLSKVTGDLVLIIDADLQDPPELLEGMCELLLSEQADVVYGKRSKRNGESIFKRASASFFYRLLHRLSDVQIPADTGDFRLITRRVSDLLVSMPERDRFTRGMVSWLGFKQIPFEYERAARYAGETKYTMKKMLRLAGDAFLGFSMAPLRLGLILSAITLFFSLAMTGYAVWSWLAFKTSPGWASMMIFLSIALSAQFAILGIMGEYVGRIYLQGKQRPLFLQSDVIDSRKLTEISGSGSQKIA